MPSTFTEEQKQFLKDNLGKMTQADIARALNKTPACINQIVKGKRSPDFFEDNTMFNPNQFFKHYSY